MADEKPIRKRCEQLWKGTLLSMLKGERKTVRRRRREMGNEVGWLENHRITGLGAGTRPSFFFYPQVRARRLEVYLELILRPMQGLKHMIIWACVRNRGGQSVRGSLMLNPLGREKDERVGWLEGKSVCSR